ncbi:hypothetical protein [Sulfitobacter sp. S190]|uniref:hypothetical protein n=1 Tax=Sulfitobacter sp. S190 TaxID=2867022 RepID=UPI0021A49552|nr:hypothetical protein [Sulfitobacter sp. S190]UWR21433.1 hypothetical protein K3756_12045 [Sulfitobacter sp. S190]
MINNNKILTVSYGTFSCTLEGFDDSFGTMKAIAEYFRDLAADDRYFGAEPPQPDAQMLARIAQREISRHVEAREHEGKIVLSAQENAQIAAPAAAVAATAAATAPAAEAPEPVAAREDVTPPAPAAEAPPMDEVTADVETAAQDDAPDASDAKGVADAHTDHEDMPDIVPSLPDAEVEAFFAEAEPEASADVFEDDVPPAPVTADQTATSIAEKLKRIRAVVSSQTDETDDADTAYLEDEHAQDAASGEDAEEHAAIDISVDVEAEDDAQVDVEVNVEMADEDAVEEAEAVSADAAENPVIADTLRDIEDALDADDEMETVSEFDPDDADEYDDVAALLSRLDAEVEAEPVDADEVAETEAVSESDEDNTPEDEMASEEVDVAEDGSSDDNILAALASHDDDAGDAEDDNLFDADGETAADSEADDDDRPAPRARVIKVKRAALEAAIESGQLEEYEDDDAEAPSSVPLADRSSLSDEAEAELARELAELEAELNDDDIVAADAEVAAEDDAVEAEDAEGAETTEDLPTADAAFDSTDEPIENVETATDAPAETADMQETPDDDLTRLMAEAKSQMDEPESATRRNAFTHLRAAVAAKKADEAVSGSDADDEADEAYRDDLASVVRPRRPEARGTRTERPSDMRPAPLKLVAEQRIDVDTANAAPVRPRRVAAVVDTPPATADGSFADFAEEQGAHDLSDMLEAAASYMSFVEGQSQFSRPQLMNKVRQIHEGELTREDGLRSFGRLLREGKIEKIKGGRFQVSDQIGFKPDARAAG